ncbi:unnamed protein product [Vicia faba]|uniref:Caffeic acid O-methyltransferase n=1 Tax=Vicia faba TaxID=3906 RepID=A0AAV0Z5B4_VICFA|nr:unnamed protein product [Vicia faba]
MDTYNNEKGNNIMEIPTPQTDDSDTLLAMVLGANMVFPAVLNAAIELNLFEIIAKESNDGFTSAIEIASKLQAQHSDLPNRLERMLCMRASYSLLSVSTRTNDNGSNEAIIDPEIDLFKKVNGISKYEYFGKDQQINRLFNKSMTDTCNVHIKRVLDIYKGFEGLSTSVDVGGGNGQSLKLIIAKYPSIKAINFDLPQVIDNAPPFTDIEHVGGSMFESIPKGDAIILKIDEQCIEILRNCHKAIPPNGKLVEGKELQKNTSLGKQKQAGFSKLQVVCRAFSIVGVMELYK